MRELTKPGLTIICGLISIMCIGGGYAMQYINRDSVALVLIGRNMVALGQCTTGATLAYAGVECMYMWNGREYRQERERLRRQGYDEEANFFDPEDPIQQSPVY